MNNDDLDVNFTDLSKFRKKIEVPPYPLVGIVGQQSMRKAVLLAASSPVIGNLIIIGEAGTGKSASVRGLRDILPEADMVNECGFNCDPKHSDKLCPGCMSAKDQLNSSPRRIPLIEIPVGASDRRIFGGFDSQSRFRPGFVGLANRGYLLISRANLLDSGMLETILDISESGIHKSKSGDMEFIHPARFNVIATMNPEDGEMEKELLDRFSLAVKVQSIKDIEERIEIVRRVEAYRQNPEDFVHRNRREMAAFAHRIKRARDLVNRVDMPKKVEEAMGKVLKRVGNDNEIARRILTDATIANAAFDDRVWATVDDLAEVGDMVLGHRKG